MRNWTLALPTAALTAFFAIAGQLTLGVDIDHIFAPRSPQVIGFGAPPDLATVGEFFVIVVLFGLVMTVVGAGVYVGADAALHGRPVRISVVAFGGAAFLGTLLLFDLLMCGIALVGMIVVMILGMITGGFFIALAVPIWLCLALFASYGLWFVMPLIILGGKSASSALIESWHLAYSNVDKVLPIGIGIVLISAVSWGANYALDMIPVASFVGPVVIGSLFLAFQAVSAARLYLELTATPAEPEGS